MIKFDENVYKILIRNNFAKKVVETPFFLNCTERFKFYAYVLGNYGNNSRKSMDSVKLCYFQYDKHILSFEKLQG